MPGELLDEDHGVGLRAVPLVGTVQGAPELLHQGGGFSARSRVDGIRLVDVVAQRNQRRELRAGGDRDLVGDRGGSVVE
jgi:hypothetical protein